MQTYDQQPTHGNPTYANNQTNYSQYGTDWKSKFPKIIVLILSILQFIFTALIFILEIASLGVLIYRPTGVGIWCAIPFLTACILTFILVRRKDASRKWSTLVLIAQLILLVFTFILIGITGNFVQTGGIDYSYVNTYYYTGYTNDGFGGSYSTKYKITQAELAFGILLMFSGFAYVAIYIYVTIVALWLPHHSLDIGNILHD